MMAQHRGYGLADFVARGCAAAATVAFIARRSAAAATMATTLVAILMPRLLPVALMRLSLRALLMSSPSRHCRDRHRGSTLGTGLRHGRGQSQDSISGTDLQVGDTVEIARY